MENAPPQLVYFHGKKMENQALIDVSGRNLGELVGNRHVFKPSNLADWLILEDLPAAGIGFFRELTKKISNIFYPPDIQLFLWNPVTLQSIDLPVIEDSSKECIRHVLITSNPKFPDSLVLVFLDKSILFWDVNGADKSWTNVGFPDDFFEPDGGFQKPVFALLKDSNSVLVRTGLRSRYPIAIVEIEENPKRLVIRPQKKEMVSTTHPRTYVAPNVCAVIMKAHWVACDGEIFVVYVYRGGSGRQVEPKIPREVVGTSVFKLEYSSSTMQYSQNILVTCPNRSFFISSKQVLCFPTTNADEGNKVYMVLGERVLYTYHIENKTLSRSFLPKNLPVSPYWISGFPSAPPPENPNQGKYRKCANGEEKNVIGKKLDHLPLDILKHFSSHFLKNPVDYLNFRATNKLFRSVGSTKEWTRNISMCPMLMIPLDGDVSFMVDPVSGNKYNLNTSFRHGFSAICSSSNGWLLMYNDMIPRDGLFKLRLYNPMTKSRICLPDQSRSLSVYIITNCRVFKIPVNRTTILRFQFLDLDRNSISWNSGEINNEDDVEAVNVNQSNIDPACLHDSFYYYLVENGDLACYVYNQDQNMLDLVKIPLDLPCSDFFEQRFIVAGYGAFAVLSVYIGKEWKWLRVFEYDIFKFLSKWVEVKNLGNYNIYLSTVSCICKEAEYPAKGNRIYLSRFHGGHVVYYSLDTQKFHTGEGDSSVVVSYYESEEQLNSCWFEPSLDSKF